MSNIKIFDLVLSVLVEFLLHGNCELKLNVSINGIHLFVSFKTGTGQINCLSSILVALVAVEENTIQGNEQK